MNERQQKLNDTRAMLDWLEAHPDVPLPQEIDFGGFAIYSMDTKQDALLLAREFGAARKEYDGSFLHLSKKFGTQALRAVFNRESVCERVVVGTEVVPERVEPERIREIIEWRCEPILEGGAV